MKMIAIKMFLVLLAGVAAFRARKTIFALLKEAEGLVYTAPSRALELCNEVDQFSDEELVQAGVHDWLHGIRAAAKALAY